MIDDDGREGLARQTAMKRQIDVRVKQMSTVSTDKEELGVRRRSIDLRGNGH
jgi:hypothetical protein